MTIGSLFSGIGGLELGLERAGLGPVVWQVEKDPFCRSVLKKHWPEVEKHEDVRTAGPLARVDIICGGFPCQDISHAGKGAGLAGERSGLWREFRRIVSELAPFVVIVENVASGARRWLPHVRRDLHVLGYRTRALEIRASDIGLPHSRARIFVVAHAHREGQLQQEWSLQEERGRTRHGRQAKKRWSVAAEPAVGRVADGVPRRVDRLRALGNAVVPQCAEVVGRIVASEHKRSDSKEE